MTTFDTMRVSSQTAVILACVGLSVVSALPAGAAGPPSTKATVLPASGALPEGADLLLALTGTNVGDGFPDSFAPVRFTSGERDVVVTPEPLPCEPALEGYGFHTCWFRLPTAGLLAGDTFVVTLGDEALDEDPTFTLTAGSDDVAPELGAVAGASFEYLLGGWEGTQCSGRSEDRFRIAIDIDASDDDSALLYEIYRAGEAAPLHVGSRAHVTLLADAPRRECLEVSAVDAAGNRSARSLETCLDLDLDDPRELDPDNPCIAEGQQANGLACACASVAFSPASGALASLLLLGAAFVRRRKRNERL